MYPAQPPGPAHSAASPGDQGRERCLKVSLPLITSWIPQEEQEGEQQEEEGAGPRTPVTHQLSHGMQKPRPLTQMEGKEPPTLSWF